jgi:hypothetical protein
MKIRRPILSSALAAVLLLSMGPMPAPIYMNVPLDETLQTSVKLSQAVLCDGSVRLDPGMYDLKIRSLGDGTARATFTGNGKTGHASGKVQGHDGIVVQGGLQPGEANAVQKVQPGPGKSDGIIIQGGSQPAAVHFSTLGFTPQSPASLQKVGNQVSLLLKGHGNNQILIGLLVPAVQKVREAAHAPMK